MVKIAFDIDGVLADFELAFINHFRKFYQPDLPLDVRAENWDFGNILPPEMFGVIFRELRAIDNFWTNLPGVEENIVALREYISAHGEREVYFITSRPDCAGGSAVSMTQLWLMDHGLPFVNLHVVQKPEEKLVLLEANGIQYFIDDYGPTIASCQALPGTKSYVLDQRYNRAYKSLPRVVSVAEFLINVELSA